MTTIGFAASRADAINSELHQCLQDGIIDAVCVSSHNTRFCFPTLPRVTCCLLPFIIVLYSNFSSFHHLLFVCSCILHLIALWAERHRAWDLRVSVWNHLQIQWIVPLASETSLWSWPGMSIDAGGSRAVTLGALNSLEDGPIRGPVGMGACQERNEAVIELQQGQETCRCRGRIISCRGRERHLLLTRISRSTTPYFLGLGFLRQSLSHPSGRENNPAIRCVRGDENKKERETETK